MSSETALISVIIPAFNVEEYIGQAIESVLRQSRGDFELIVVDDGSLDRTAEVAGSFEDSRVRVVHQPNVGFAAARNRGLEVSTGAYVAFLDGDDQWLAEKLEVQAAWLDRHPETDLVFGATRMVERDGSDAGRAIIRNPGVASFARMLTEDLIGNGSSQMLRREAAERAGGFDTNLAASVDHDLWLRIALLRPDNVFGLDDVVTLYRRRRGQISSDVQAKERSWRQLVAKMERLAPEQAVVRPAAWANHLRVLSSVAYENGEYGEAARLMARALHHDAPYLLADQRTWLQGLAIAASMILPDALHARIDGAARGLRSRWHGVRR
jgi:glycosyltransferase involved in cell wall biosynthesis